MLRSIYRTLFLAFLIVLPSLKSAAEINGIILHQYGGASTLMPFDDIKEITFTSDQLKIGNKYYPLSNIKRYEFCDIADISKIDNIIPEGIHINPEGIITFANENDAINSRVYDIQGHECLFSRNGSTIDFSVLSQGIYIVSYGQKAIKIIKK